MEGMKLLHVCLLVVFTSQDVSALNIRNKLLGKCLQVSGEYSGGRITIEECDPNSSQQDWRWLPGGYALSSHHNGECLTAQDGKPRAVRLQPCIPLSEGTAELMGDDISQMWTCSKKGHLSMMGKEWHLSVSPESGLVFLSRERKQASRWRTLDKQTLCSNIREGEHYVNHSHHQPVEEMPSVPQGYGPDVNSLAETYKGTVTRVAETQSNPLENGAHFSLTTLSPKDPTMVFFTMDYGMGWKITMLVLTSLVLFLGTMIFIHNVYSDRRRKMVFVVKSHPSSTETSAPGSPLLGERVPLTEHAMCLPERSPSLHRGEILVEWKDGSVTPLYEA